MYFKILKNDLTSEDFQFKLGLNVLEHFSLNKPKNSFKFSDESHILWYCDCGDKICVIEVPEDEEIIDHSYWYESNSIIIKEIRDLWTVETFEWLKSVDVNIQANIDNLLSTASNYGYLDIVKYLVIAKYLVNEYSNININFDKSLMMSLYSDNFEITKYLVENGGNINSYNVFDFIFTYMGDEVDKLQFLIDIGFDIHSFDDAALMIAIRKGNINIVKFLLSNGCDIHVNNDNPLFTAIRNNKLYITLYLLEHGADINRCIESLKSPIIKKGVPISKLS